MTGLLPLAVGDLEVPSLLSLLDKAFPGGLTHFLHQNQDVFYSWLIVALASLFVVRASRRYTAGKPGGLQSLMEMIVETFDGYVTGMLGAKEGRVYLPFLATLFVYILLCNLFGLVPFMMAPTAVWSVAPALALMTFLVVQYTAIVKLGPAKYLYHLMNEPRGGMWLMAPLFLLIHLIGELAKPVSLSLRLFGNVLGKDVLLAVFLTLGVLIALAAAGDLGGWILPLHLPFMFLGLMLGAIQALVFMLLATVYIQMALPHRESHGESGEGHG